MTPDHNARRVQDFDSLPQYIAHQQEQARRNADRYNRWLRTWGRWALIAALAAFLILLASHAAPKAIASLADPLAGMPY